MAKTSRLRSSRVTRSRSHDIPDEVSLPSEPPALPQGSRVNRRSQGGAQDQQSRDLITVEEASLDQEEDFNDQAREAESKTSGLNTPAHSHISTAVVEDIDRENAIRDLEMLHNTTDRILKALAQASPSRNSSPSREEIQIAVDDSQSRLNKQVLGSRQSFKEESSTFLVDDGFLQPDIIVRIMFRPKPIPAMTNPSRDWRPDEIISKINLALLTQQLLAWYGGREPANKMWSEICILDNEFPLPFLSSFNKSDPANPSVRDLGSSSLLNETFEVALELRTQLAILNLQRQRKGTDLEFELAQVFYSVPEDDLETLDKAEQLESYPFRTWGVSGLGSDLHHHFTQSIKDRYDILKVLTPNQANPADSSSFAAVRDRFPWADFVFMTMEWIHRRNEELSASLFRRGSADHIINCLAQQRDIPAPQIQKPAKRTSSRHLAQAIEYIRQNKAPEQPGPKANVAAEKKDNPGYDDDLFVPQEDRQESPRPSPGALSAKERLRQVARKDRQNKENLLKSQASKGKARFIDPQADAEVVEWSQDTEVTQRPSRALKRRQERQDEEVSEDEGFQRGPARKRSSPVYDEEEGAESTIPPSTAIQDESDRRQVASDTYRNINSTARTLVSTQIPRKVQMRKRWTDEETGALQNYIEELGTSWAAIKRLDDDHEPSLLADRDQVALKDKARNMKFDYIKSRAALPENFERIPLDSKMKLRLEEMRIDYYGP